MPSNLTVLAVGGNSLIKEKNKIALSFQYESVKETSKFIADLVEAGLDLVITHGNGPQVGFIYRRGEIAVTELPLVPLDICAADTQGAIKYMFEKALMNEFRKRGIERKIAAVVTQTLVDGNDPAFENPSKPIGSFMSEEEAEAKKKESGWELMEDAGRGYRRVVPSPLPVEIIELEAIKLLVKNDYIVLAVGGGGVAVMRNEQGDLEGLEAIIDKDKASSLLARNIGAGNLIISTSVDEVYLNFGEKNQKALRNVSLPEINKYLEEGHFKPGSMKPKIEATIEFLEGGGEKAIITSPENLLKAFKGEAGTTITK
jgi:carbamate kinase